MLKLSILFVSFFNLVLNFSAYQYNEDNIKAYFENLKKIMKNIKAKLDDNDNKISNLEFF